MSERNTEEDNRTADALAADLETHLGNLDALRKPTARAISTASAPKPYDPASAGQKAWPVGKSSAMAAPYGNETESVLGYEELARILRLAYDQSATGKGKERHAVGPVGFQPWHHQPILANARQVGPAGPAQQIMKKAGESVMMANRENFAGAMSEALGAIVYAAALYRLYEEMEQVT